MAVRVPGSKAQVTALTAMWPPKRTVRSRVSRMGMGGGLCGEMTESLRFARGGGLVAIATEAGVRPVCALVRPGGIGGASGTVWGVRSTVSKQVFNTEAER